MFCYAGVWVHDCGSAEQHALALHVPSQRRRLRCGRVLAGEIAAVRCLCLHHSATNLDSFDCGNCRFGVFMAVRTGLSSRTCSLPSRTAARCSDAGHHLRGFGVAPVMCARCDLLTSICRRAAHVRFVAPFSIRWHIVYCPRFSILQCAFLLGYAAFDSHPGPFR